MMAGSQNSDSLPAVDDMAVCGVRAKINGATVTGIELTRCSTKSHDWKTKSTVTVFEDPASGTWQVDPTMCPMDSYVAGVALDTDSSHRVTKMDV